MQYAIDKVYKVELGNLKQKIHIRGTNKNNPLLLFLHGGPGICNREAIISKHSDLCGKFTVIAWDQRGTGGSYWGTKRETLTINQLIEDANELCEYLCKKFHKKKLFICGGSWGSQLGTYLCQKYPKRIGAYVGFGQVVNGIRNEEISYEFCMKQAKKAGDKKSIQILKEVGPPVEAQYKPVFKGLMKQRKIMKKYGGHSTKPGGYWKHTVKPALTSREMSLTDKLGLIKGYKLSLSELWPQMPYYNFVTDCKPFEMPYYIFQGRHDNNTPSSLVSEFYEALQAPDKDLVWFEHSAHNPLNEESKRFKSMLCKKLLPLGL